MPVIFYMGAEHLNSGPYGCIVCALTHWAISAACVTISVLIFSDVKTERLNNLLAVENGLPALLMSSHSPGPRHSIGSLCGVLSM